MALTRAYNWQAPMVGESAETGDQPGKTIRLGFIGLGLMGGTTLKTVLLRPDVEIVALSDVDGRRLDQAAALVAEAKGQDSFARFRDFRELNRCAAVDAVVVSTPDHWHALQGIDAMRCGKDAYIEKPLALTVAEGRRLCDVAAETGRICQTGSQQRSSREFHYACELMRNGHLGTLQSVVLGIPANNCTSDSVGEPDPVPPEFDYDMWVGPAPWRPYHEKGCHYAFRFISDFSGGQMTNWGAHMMDIVQWALDADASGPIRVSGTGEFAPTGLFDTADQIDVEWQYANGTTVHCTTGAPRCRFTGTEGTIEVGRGHFEATPEYLNDIRFSEDDVRLYKSDDHMGNFLDSVRARRQPICPAEVGHRAATTCHIANIAIRVGRPLEWDPVAECFVNDGEANRMLSRRMREPWSLQLV